MYLLYNDAMGRWSLSSFLVVVLNVAWCLVAFALVLAICLAALAAFHGIAGGETDIPVSFSIDAQALPVRAPSLGIERAQLENVRGSLKFSPLPGASFVGPALAGLALMLAAVLSVVGQLRAVIRTLRDAAVRASQRQEVFRTGTRLDEDQSLTI